MLTELAKWHLEPKDLITPLITLLGFAWAILQYRWTSNSEFTKPLRQAQFNLYQEACSAAAKLATEADTNSDAWKESKADFLDFYFGPLAILEFEAVEQAMIEFKECLDEGIQGPALLNLSLKLAHTCRESAGLDWGVSLPQLTGKYNKQKPASQQPQDVTAPMQIP